MKKIAIIGASIGQKQLYIKAKGYGLYVIGFAWEQGAICKNLADKFYPISILEKDKIVELCISEGVEGVVSNASELTNKVVSYVAEKLGLIGNSYSNVIRISDKSKVRHLTNNINGLNQVQSFEYKSNSENVHFPCIVKPIIGGGKKGVSFAANQEQLLEAVKYAQKCSSEKIIIEEYIDGKELSVETISFRGKHYVVQITDKENSGPPHFVELGHHQPAQLDDVLYDKIQSVAIDILKSLDFQNGASHIELKVNADNRVYLIEFNPRGGGDEISNSLVELSTGYDYVLSMIRVAIGDFEPEPIKNIAHAGIYYFCKLNEDKIDFFNSSANQPWLVNRGILRDGMTESTGNSDRNAFLIYKNDCKIKLSDPYFSIEVIKKQVNAHEILVDFYNKKNKENKISKEIDYLWIDKILKYADIIAYRLNGNIVGLFILYCNNETTKEAYCAGVYVLKEYRQRHIAQVLLNAALKICIKRSFKRINLYCNNPIALNWYLKNNFKEIKKEFAPKCGEGLYSFLSLKIGS